MKGARILFSAALVALLAACELTETENEQLERWLRCDDCMGLRSEVAALGYRAIPRLGSAVIDPPPYGVENVRLQVLLAYERMSGMGPLPLSADELVEHSLGGYVSQYQKHAALSLGDIARKGGLACALQRCQRKALGELRTAFEFDSLTRERSGGEGHYRTDVLSVVREQIESLSDTTRLPDLGIVILRNPPSPIHPGDTFQLVARVIDVGGRELPRTIVWSSSDAAVATVDSDGTFIAQGLGAVQITASAPPYSEAIPAVVTLQPGLVVNP